MKYSKEYLERTGKSKEDKELDKIIERINKNIKEYKAKRLITSLRGDFKVYKSLFSLSYYFNLRGNKLIFESTYGKGQWDFKPPIRLLKEIEKITKREIIIE